MTLAEGCVLFVAAFAAGALNSVAGGGSFISFPALIFTGVPALYANTTNSVAIWPGSVASVGAYRGELAKRHEGLLLMSVVSIVGGIVGAVVLLRTSPSVFVSLVPYLLLLATLLFAFGGRLTRWVRSRVSSGNLLSGHNSRPVVAGVALLQLVIAAYGGFFGGGMGILLLASLSMLGMENIHTMNGYKVVLTTFINGVAVALFIIAGAVVWPKALLMVVGSIVGGYAGGYYAQKINPKYVRAFVIALGLGLTAYFFVRG